MQKQRKSHRMRGFAGRGAVKSYIGAIDQGTTSTRFMVFDKDARIVAVAQKEHRQIYPQPGWVGHDADEILRRTYEVIGEALVRRIVQPSDLAATSDTKQGTAPVLLRRTNGTRL